jgi:hypothetical protein
MPNLLQRQKSWGNLKPSVSARLNRASPIAPKTLSLLFNEGAGLTVHNRANQAASGTLSGNATWVAGRGGKAIALNTTAQTGKISFAGVTFGTTFWWSMWLYPMVNSGGYCLLAGDAAATAALYYRGATNKLDFVYTPGGDHLNNTALVTNTWNHVVVTANAGAGTFYLNGKADGIFASWPGTTMDRMGLDNFAEYWVGRMESFMGSSGESLSAAEVWKLYTDRYSMFLAPPPVRLLKTGAVVFVGATSGGITLGGTAGPTITFSPSTTGGVTLGGSSAPAAAFSPPTAGGLSLGGSSAPQTTFTAATSGGITFGGSSTLATVFVASASGGLTLGGSSVATLVFSLTTSGGITFGGSSSGTKVLPTDLVSALQAFWAGTPELAAITAGFYVQVDPATIPPPWVNLESITEVLPGSSIEDESEDASFTVRTTDLAYTKHLGALIKKHVTSGPERTIAPREELQWLDEVTGLVGYERYNLQFNSTPKRKPGLGPGGMPIWEYVVMFRFCVNRTGATP